MIWWAKKGVWFSPSGASYVDHIDPNSVSSIAVIRHAALGDMVLTRPFLIEARRCFPKAKITLSVVSNYTRGAPEDLVDALHVAFGSDQKGIGLTRQIQRAKELGPQEIIFDLASTARSAWICVLNRAPLKMGFPYKWMLRRSIYNAAVHRSDLSFEADNMLDMLRLLGLPVSPRLRFDLPLGPATHTQPYIVYFCSASTPDKCWPAEHFATLIERMAERYPHYTHLVLKGLSEWESAQGVTARAAHRPNVHSVSVTDLQDTVDLLGHARLLVSNDTGIRHLAVAAGTPTVGIFFCTPPFRYWPRDGRHSVVFSRDGTAPAVSQAASAVAALLEND